MSNEKQRFDEEYYCNRHPDVAAAIAAGVVSNGWVHYEQSGRREGREIRLRPVLVEPVRLVIWDLDETFWRGTWTEGGILEYIQEHHDLVIKLAQRGIMSSICSKNDSEIIIEFLRAKDIDKYFVFPSISWEPKGRRVKEIIENFQLRPATVMFIDDNPNNLGEAAAILPDLQISSETFIPSILFDDRFKGKDDKSLSRLTQYKLLEIRKIDETTSKNGNQDFLRTCDIRVCIDYDIDSNIERVIELLTRTNQLNFTKKPFPGDVGLAAHQIRQEINFFGRQAGLIRVSDRYGDYGYVGFFVTETWRNDHVAGRANRTLKHFCFSCRTLGMLVEKWVFDYLGKPALEVVGQVLTDLYSTQQVDWIRLVTSMSPDAKIQDELAPEIRVYGGCEAGAIAVYLAASTKNVEVLGNFAAGPLFVRVNSAAIALSTFSRGETNFAEEAKSLGIPIDLAARDYMAEASTGTAFIFSCGMDAHRPYRYRHKNAGWELSVELLTCPEVDLSSTDAGALQEHLLRGRDTSPAFLDSSHAVAAHIRENYLRVRDLSISEVISTMRVLIERCPIGSKFIILLDHDIIRSAEGQLSNAQFVTSYNNALRELAATYNFVEVVAFSDVLEGEHQIQPGGNHYDRVVYLRMAEKIASAVRDIFPRV